MLSIYGNTAQKHKDTVLTHKEYLTYMYSDVKGFITRSVIPPNRNGSYYETFNLSGRLIHKNSYYGVKNVYTSMNTFLNRHKTGDDNSGRKVQNIKRLNALYIDLDCYNVGMTQEQILCELKDKYFGQKIPCPTFVVNSGRGMYLIWKINEDRNAFPRWTSVQNYLFDQLKGLGADPQALDAARILRVPCSINSKNNKIVQIMLFNDVKYTLYEIIKKYDIKPKFTKKARIEPVYPYGEATVKQRTIAAWQANKFGVQLPDFKKYEETFEFINKYSNYSCDEKKENKKILYFANSKSVGNILEGRCNDLFKLFKIRKGENCCREYALFLCRLWYGEKTNDFEYALQQTYALNRSFDVPFTETYVRTRTKSAETKLKSGRTYKYSLSKIIKVLKITTEEQKQLDYLCINPVSKAARRKKSNRKAYLKRIAEEGKTTKKESIGKRRSTIAKLIYGGKSKKEICKIMYISSRTYDRDKAAIVASGLLEQVKNIVPSVAKATKKALEMFKTTFSPKIKSTYYKRTPFGCSASKYIQISIWDLQGDTG